VIKTDVTRAILLCNFVAQLVFRNKVASVTRQVAQPFNSHATLFLLQGCWMLIGQFLSMFMFLCRVH